MAGSDVVGQVDAEQKRHPVAAVAVATVKKFQEERSTRMAAMIAFWAFFSVFPLLLLLVSLLGFFLPGSMKSTVLHHVAATFPMVDPNTVGHLHGAVWTVALGAITALWSGTAVVRSTEFAFNSVWEIPMSERPKLGEQMVRALKALSTIGVGLVASSALSGFVTGQDIGVNLGAAGRAAGYVIAAALDVGLFLVAFRMLTDRRVTFRDVLPGALLSGTVFWVLQQLSSLIISRHLNQAQSTYGHFATVITMLWWFYLEAVVTLLGAQLNVVLHHRLHPRSLNAEAERTDADRRTLEAYADSRRYEDDEEVDTRLEGRRGEGDGDRPR